jgi:hypothetical protein
MLVSYLRTPSPIVGRPLFYIFTLILFLLIHVKAEACHPVLWPANSHFQPSQTLTHSANKILTKPIHPIPTLGSAGKLSLHDPQLLASREGFKDADHAALLALAFATTQQNNYLQKAKEILLAWSQVNSPTGHPIDETRLEGMIWAYDLIACQLSSDENNQIKKWFEKIRLKKREWKFGEVTEKNNHRIHQLKMLLLLDKVLQRRDDTENDIKKIKKYSHININSTSGMTVDYLERSALYYHNYVMQPWLTIRLVSDCCVEPVEQAFEFLKQAILQNTIHHEFSHTTSKTDDLRAKNGFSYAKKDSSFDVGKAAPTIVLYYTLNTSQPEASLWQIQQQTKSSPWLDFLRARRVLWNHQD